MSTVWFLPAMLWAADEEAKQLFKEANQCYQEGKFNEALEHYKKLENLGYQSGALYYNMGNTYYKLGAVGYAILYYEKAAKLIGNDEDLIANFEHAPKRNKNKNQKKPPLVIDPKK
jgi:tetratricopeptide (TPR) repeat protein